jgi:hypothetical protein
MTVLTLFAETLGTAPSILRWSSKSVSVQCIHECTLDDSVHHEDHTLASASSFVEMFKFPADTLDKTTGLYLGKFLPRRCPAVPTQWAHEEAPPSSCGGATGPTLLF